MSVSDQRLSDTGLRKLENTATIASGVDVMSGDCDVVGGGLTLQCGNSVVGTHVSVSQGATVGHALQLVGGLRAEQGAEVRGGVTVTQHGLAVEAGISIEGGVRSRGGVASSADVSVTGGVHIPTAATFVADGLVSDMHVDISGGASTNAECTHKPFVYNIRRHLDL